MLFHCLSLEKTDRWFFLFGQQKSFGFSKKRSFFTRTMHGKSKTAQLIEKQYINRFFLEQIYYIRFPISSFLPVQKNGLEQIYYIFRPGPATKN